MIKLLYTQAISEAPAAGLEWSVEAEAGVHKASNPFSSGYYTSTPSLWQGGVGVRYMMNEKFGVKLDAGYNSIESHDDSQAFETKYFRMHFFTEE